MEQGNGTKPKKHTTYLLKDIGSVHEDKKLSSKSRATTSEFDSMTEELRQMSLDVKKDKHPHTEPGTHWLGIDRSRVAGVERPWDALAYVGTRKSNAQQGHGQQHTRPASKNPSSLDVERGSNVQ